MSEQLNNVIELDVLINEMHNAKDLLLHYLNEGIPQTNETGQIVGVYHLQGAEREGMEQECHKVVSIIHHLTEYEKLKSVKK
ncbi:hypothetical protein QQ054_10705 [Oscillatoria amoena NRMC-F 0135]|nr:hypothetical protein [Oscillatoria amoena NRMC-F 0135]